jgi:hypothetical protein
MRATTSGLRGGMRRRRLLAEHQYREPARIVGAELGVGPGPKGGRIFTVAPEEFEAAANGPCDRRPVLAVGADETDADGLRRPIGKRALLFEHFKSAPEALMHRSFFHRR